MTEKMGNTTPILTLKLLASLRVLDQMMQEKRAATHQDAFPFVDYPIEGIVARDFARVAWTRSQGWRRPGRHGLKGTGLPMVAGVVLHRLLDLGLVHRVRTPTKQYRWQPSEQGEKRIKQEAEMAKSKQKALLKQAKEAINELFDDKTASYEERLASAEELKTEIGMACDGFRADIKNRDAKPA